MMIQGVLEEEQNKLAMPENRIPILDGNVFH